MSTNDFSNKENFNVSEQIQQEIHEKLKQYVWNWVKWFDFHNTEWILDEKSVWKVKVYFSKLLDTVVRNSRTNIWNNEILKKEWGNTWKVAVQIALESLWYEVWKIDGKLWPKSIQAIKNFQAANGLLVTWFPWELTVKALLEAMGGWKPIDQNAIAAANEHINDLKWDRPSNTTDMETEGVLVNNGKREQIDDKWFCEWKGLQGTLNYDNFVVDVRSQGNKFILDKCGCPLNVIKKGKDYREQKKNLYWFFKEIDHVLTLSTQDKQHTKVSGINWSSFWWEVGKFDGFDADFWNLQIKWTKQFSDEDVLTDVEQNYWVNSVDLAQWLNDTRDSFLDHKQSLV